MCGTLLLALAGCLFKPAPPVNKVVHLKDFKYSPAKISIRPGDSITWINEDPVQHTVTAVSEDYDSGVMEQGGRVEMTFDEAGTFDYQCAPHPLMKGSIVIE